MDSKLFQIKLHYFVRILLNFFLKLNNQIIFLISYQEFVLFFDCFKFFTLFLKFDLNLSIFFLIINYFFLSYFFWTWFIYRYIIFIFFIKLFLSFQKLNVKLFILISILLHFSQSFSINFLLLKVMTFINKIVALSIKMLK